MRIDPSMQALFKNVKEVPADPVIHLTSVRSDIARQFSGLQTGDIVWAQVTGLDGNNLLIQTLNGNTIRAGFTGNILFMPGDNLELMLDSRKDGRVSFRLLSLNSQPVRMEVSGLENLLIRSGIEPSSQNVRLSQILMENGYIPTQQNILNLSRITQDQPELPQALSSFLAANHLEPSQESIRHILQLSSGPASLGSRTQELLNTLKKLWSEPGTATRQKTEQPAPAGPPVQIQENARATLAFTNAFIRNIAGQPALAETVLQTQGFEHLASRLSEMRGQDAQAAINAFVSSLHLPPAQEKAVASGLASVYQESVSWATDYKQAVQPYGGPSASSNLTISDQSGTAGQAGPPDAALGGAVRVLFKLNEFFAALRPVDTAFNSQEIRKALETQEKLAQSVHWDISRLAGEKSVPARQAAEIRTQIEFTSRLEYFYYFQIPVQFENKTNTAELYIFERNKKDKADPDANAILIALDMQRLGRVETMLHSHGGSMDISIRLESEPICLYFKNSAHSLKESLSDTGFTIKSLEFGVLKKKTTLLNAPGVFLNEKSISPGGLDIQV